MLKLALALILIATTSFAADNNKIGTDRYGNDIYILSEQQEVAYNIYSTNIRIDYRIKEPAQNAIPPIRGMDKRKYRVYVDHAEHNIIVDCNGLQRVTVLDSRLYNNIGKEIEVYRPVYKQDTRFRINSEKIIREYFCR